MGDRLTVGYPALQLLLEKEGFDGDSWIHMRARHMRIAQHPSSYDQFQISKRNIYVHILIQPPRTLQALLHHPQPIPPLLFPSLPSSLHPSLAFPTFLSHLHPRLNNRPPVRPSHYEFCACTDPEYSGSGYKSSLRLTPSSSLKGFRSRRYSSYWPLFSTLALMPVWWEGQLGG